MEPKKIEPKRTEIRMTEPAIQIDGLGVRYGRTSILEGISLNVEPGSVQALLGRNSAGKSSLVRCLLGHQKPQSGSVHLLGRDVWKHRVELMQTIGVVPETGDAPPNMNARQLSRFCSKLYPTWDEATLVERLERFEVPLKVPFGKLSKGQKGQVHLALALAHSPELLVLDDPTLGLDVVARKSVFEELVVELADRGTTVFLTSHDLPGIEAIASHVAFLRGGRLILDEEIEGLKQRFRRLVFGPATEEEARRLTADLGPLAVESRGRDTEVLVENFDEEAFAELREAPEVKRAEALPVSLEDALIAVAENAGRERPS